MPFTQQQTAHPCTGSNWRATLLLPALLMLLTLSGCENNKVQELQNQVDQQKKEVEVLKPQVKELDETKKAMAELQKKMEALTKEQNQAKIREQEREINAQIAQVRQKLEPIQRKVKANQPLSKNEIDAYNTLTVQLRTRQDNKKELGNTSAVPAPANDR